MIKRILIVLLFPLAVFVLTACEAPPILFKVEDNNIPTKFPANVRVDYYISNNAINLFSKHTYITFKKSDGRFRQYTVYPVKKTKDGYIIIGTEEENYTIPSPKKFGYLGVYQLKEKNGHLTIKFNSKSDLKLFTNYTILGIEDVCEYYKCTKK